MDHTGKPILVSFCNTGRREKTAVMKVDLASERVFPVELGFPHGVTSCTGLTKDSSHVYALFESDTKHYVAVLQLGSLVPLYYQPLPEVKDGHSILVAEDYLYVVSTGTDEVVRYERVGHGFRDPKVIWRASASRDDTHHVNSITQWRGNLVVGAFGPRLGSLWSSASEGYLHDVDRGLCIQSGIYHPHSLSVRAKSFYWCESQRRLFWCFGGPIASLDGYVRGVCWLSDRNVCLGTSVGRKHSASAALVGNPADPGEPLGRCEVCVLDIVAGRFEKRLDLTCVGHEIYDLLTIEDSNG
jgi:hypothetical protein